MKNKRFYALLAALVLCVAFPRFAVAENFEDLLCNVEETEQTRLVVLYRETPMQSDGALNACATPETETHFLSEQVAVMQTETHEQAEALLETLRDDPQVLAADYDDAMPLLELPNDPYVGSGSAWYFEKIGADQTWNRVGGAPVVVAVIDTGLNTAHPDLQGRIAQGYSCIADSSGVVDLIGHGTMVSGCIAAAANNGIGVAGVSGLANVRVAPFRAGGSSSINNSVNTAAAIAAIEKIVDERPDIQIVNMSFGSTTYNEAFAAAVRRLTDSGRIVVAAAGNHGGTAPLYPASLPGVISVGATTQTDEHAFFSAYNGFVDISAPGQQIVSTYRTGGYARTDGTSLAAPIVAGAAAVLLARSPSLSALQVENALRVTALDLGAVGQDDYFGAGRLRLDRAFQYDHSVGTLTIRNRVTGRYGEQNKPFTFTLSLTAAGSFRYSGSYSGLIGHGQSLLLKSGEAVTITGLPTQAIYTVTELEADQDGYTTTGSNAFGSIDTIGVTAAFVNQKGDIVTEPDSTSKAETTPAAPIYSLTKDEPAIVQRADGGFDFKLSAPTSATPTQLSVNGRSLKLGTDYVYMMRKGGVTLELLPAFVKTLPDGELTLRALFADGVFTTTFDKGVMALQSVPEPPATGDFGTAYVFILAGLCLAQSVKRRNRV